MLSEVVSIVKEKSSENLNAIKQASGIGNQHLPAHSLLS